MHKVPSMSSKKLIRLLEKGGAVFVRQGSTDHAIYSRVIEGKRYFGSCSDGEEDIRSCILQKDFETTEIHR